MKELHAIESREIQALEDEIGRYLNAVDVFRDEGCAPEWQAEDPRLVSDLAAAA
jgi:hypothetical protein